MTSGGDADGNAKGYQKRARDSGHISLTTTHGFVFVERMDNRYSDEVAVGALFLLISRMEYPLNNDVKRGARIRRLHDEFLYFVTPKFPQLMDPNQPYLNYLYMTKQKRPFPRLKDSFFL